MKNTKTHVPNLTSIAREHGVTRATIRAWRDEGLDLADAEAIKARVAAMKTAATDESLAEAKRRRAIADADRAELRVAAERGRMIPYDQAEAAFAVAGRGVRAALRQLEGELPGMLAGLGEAAIRRTLAERFDSVLLALSEGKFFDTPRSVSPDA